MRVEPREDYVRDVPYPRKFVPQIAPPVLRLVAALNGLATPPEDDFDYCELGSANGDTLALLAAANPGGRFVGVDFNRDHVAAADSLVTRGRLQNLRLLQRDFDDLARDALPQFDFIAAHGVLSWVGPTKRDSLLAFVRDRLKPGGLFYVSYNTMPGWAAIEPLRRLMLEHSARTTGSTLDRAREGFEYVQRLADAGAGYFASHPTAKSMIALMRTAGLPYVVHEYFNAHMQPFYSADVASMMTGLAFVGQVPLHLNVRELATPPSVKKIADTLGGRAAFETLKDFGNNELFRSDVFVKGKGERVESETRFYFEGTPFGTMTSATNVKREAKLGHYTVDYKAPVYDAVLAAIATAAATAMELAQRPELVSFGQTRVGDALRNLVLGGQVVPMRIEARSAAPGGRYRLRLPYNVMALENALADIGPLVLASPVTGSAVHVSLIEAIALHALTSAEPAERAAWIAAFASKREMPLVVGERKIKDAAELTRVVSKELERVVATIEKFVELGIVEAVS